MRFFVMHPHLTAAELERFTQVDHHDREALVALDDADIVGVARFDRLPSTDDAEVAFVAAESWQGSGVGTRLFEELAHRGRKVGITRFVADTLGDNHRMLGVFLRSGMVVQAETQAGVVHIVLDLRLRVPA
jgi:RimJ/RimL family protein N-acetyltransferase